VLTHVPEVFAYVRARLGELRGREEGVTAVEYALMVAIIALLLVGGFFALFTAVQDRYGEVSDCLDSGPQPSTCNPDAGP
jgi:Flp pilus assembly pilin Flp